MKRRTKKRFTQLLHTFASKGHISEQKAAALGAEDKKFMCEAIVQDRAAILYTLIPDDIEFLSWLHSMGYLYYYVNKQGLQFLGTSLHKLNYAVRNGSKYSTLSK